MVTDAAVDPTCTATGLTEGSHCSRCEDATTAQTVVAALGHDWVTDEAVAPTCTETGLTEGKHCSRCDQKVVQNEVPAKGHSFADGKCGVCGADDPDYIAPEEPAEELGFFARIWAAILAFFQSLLGFFKK